ncbi:Lrp/AsnC family transcriptional regulator [Thiofilum flexile]|uniref:Lrp/AsnC family transcriptional regulator n=1 Tax=Thiofilum flexile TaxID=125627 RepID=UPI0003672F43|nr:Lrp/AsnC family transcriptional regulator [Thiofilum flexile]
MTLDSFDHAILALLRQNARLSVSELAKQVNLSRSAVSQRISRLEQEGIITGYHAAVNLSPQTIRAYLIAIFHTPNCRTYGKRLQHYPEIKYVHSVAGDLDLLIFVEAPSMERLSQIRDEISTWSEVTSIKTYPLLTNVLG